MNRRIKEYNNIEQLVDPATGEYKEGIFTDIETLIKRSKRLEHLEEQRIIEKAIEDGTALSFTNLYMINIKELIGELEESKYTKRTYLGYLLLLQSYVDYNGILRKNSQTVKPFNRSDIKKVLNIASWDTTREFIELLIDKSVIKEVKTAKGKGFEMASAYCFKGKKEEEQPHIKSFNKTIRQVYAENSASDVSFLFSLIPYVSYRDNVLSHNPYEEQPEYLDVLSTKDIAEITGVSVDTVYRVIKRMTFDGLAVFKTEGKNGLRNYVINPIVVYRKQGEPAEAIVRSFKIKGK